MKQCPACHQTYEDDSMGFCLNDGVQLVNARPTSSDPQATLHIPAPRSTDPTAPQLAQEPWRAAGPTYTPPPSAADGQRNWVPWIVGGAALLLLGAIGVVGIGGFLFYKMNAPSVSSDTPSYNSNKSNSNSSGTGTGTRKPSTSTSSTVAKKSLADVSISSVTDLALEQVGNFKLGGTKSPQGHLFKNEGSTELMMATYDRTDGTNFVLLYMASYSSDTKTQSALDEIIRWSVGQGARIQSQESNTGPGGEKLGEKYVLVNSDGVEDVYWTNGRYAFNAYNGKEETGVLSAFEKSYPY